MNAYARFVPAVILLGGVLLVSGIREQHAMAPRAPMKALPRTFAGITGRDMIVPKDEQKIAGMSDYMLRFYGDSLDPAFTTYVGYYDRQVQGKSIHSPKNCLPGAGWQIMNASRVELPIAGAGTASRVMLANEGVRALVYYWYQGRGRAEASEYRVKWDLLRDAALYGRTEEALVRVVVPVKSESGTPEALKAAEAAADAVALRVVRELVPAVDVVMPTPASPKS